MPVDLLTEEMLEEAEHPKTLALSTAHLSKEDYDVLQSECCYVAPEGFWLSLNDPFVQDLESMLRDKQLSEEGLDLISELHARGYDYVLFDRDVAELEGLRTYEW